MRAHGTLTENPGAGTSDHPCWIYSTGSRPPFSVSFDEGRVALSGSIDTIGAARLTRILASTPVHGPIAVLDLALVDFVDVAGARALARWAQELGSRSIGLEVRSASPLLRRAWQVLALDALAPVEFTDEAT